MRLLTKADPLVPAGKRRTQMCVLPAQTRPSLFAGD